MDKTSLQAVREAFDAMLERRKQLENTVSGKRSDTKRAKAKRADFKPSSRFVDYPDYWQSQLQYWRLDR